MSRVLTDKEWVANLPKVTYYNRRDQMGEIRDRLLDTPIAAAGAMRSFATGATRNEDTSKPDYEGFLSPLALASFARYMNKHRMQADGQLRASDNWQKGIPLDSYMKSMMRHVMDLWMHHRGLSALATEPLEDAINGVMFNIQGYSHETEKARLAPSSPVTGGSNDGK